ncbi:hypothetical protein AVEN_179121-1 [Araneus ventricosus]|uniref:Uncharacterized protein n=1 Tax=Araneus ventricosus TaxID=182803 RepID=A0A4Y2F710_ARAVE|nr:hypothetical protein AVEN_179121-1 [Araneus ventricosus]
MINVKRRLRRSEGKKLYEYNTVFQAELLALKNATDHATSLPHQPIAILVNNQASVPAAVNPRSRNITAREICKSFITNKHIHISWIKTHLGYDGNEDADRLKSKGKSKTRSRQQKKLRSLLENHYLLRL